MAVPTRRVLLTGSRGFTGRYVRASLVAAGYDVVGLVSEGEPGPDERIADIMSATAMRDLAAEVRPDYVIHLAAISFVAHADVRAIYETNTLGTLNLLEALAALPRCPRRVILASSANVYGSVASEFIGEDVPPAPLNHYAASKLAMEAAASVYRDRLPCLVTRPFNYTGPGQAAHFLVPKIVDHFAARAQRIELGNLDVERDFLDVRSVSSIYTKLLDAAHETTGILNICSGRGTTLRAIVDMLEAITGHSIEVAVNPAFVRANEIRRLVGDNARLRAVVGEWPDYSLDETLRAMLAAAAPIR